MITLLLDGNVFPNARTCSAKLQIVYGAKLPLWTLSPFKLFTCTCTCIVCMVGGYFQEVSKGGGLPPNETLASILVTTRIIYHMHVRSADQIHAR